MPIRLDTPHNFSPGHSQVDVEYPFVMITAIQTFTTKRCMIITLQYGQVVNDVWVDSPEEPHRIRIQNTPAQMSSGEDPETGIWTEKEVVPASNLYDEMKASFVVVESMVGWETYNVLGVQLYMWLISEGYYEGAIE